MIMNIGKSKFIAIFLITFLAVIFPTYTYLIKGSKVSYDTFASEKVTTPFNLSFIAKIEGEPKYNYDCFSFFLSNKHIVTTDVCAHESMTTLKKMGLSIEGRDYVEEVDNGLLLKSVIKPIDTQSIYSVIFTEKFITQFVKAYFYYDSKPNEINYMPVVIDGKYTYLYTVILDGDKAIINFKDLPNNCEILAGSPVFTMNSADEVRINAMVTQHTPCKKNNSIVVLKSNDIGYDINNLINCVSYYTNIPGYIDEASDCNLTNYP